MTVLADPVGAVAGAATRAVQATTAAVVAVGNELLSGKVQDLNVTHVTRDLHALGVPLVLALIVPDQPDAIGEALRYALARADVVITTGGVGPTHDDVTVPSIARALGRRLVRDAGLDAAIRKWYGRHANEDVLRMAELPEGYELILDPEFFLPVLKVDRVFVLPGEPNHFKRQFEVVKKALAEVPPFFTARIRLDADESEIARDLREAEAAHRVAIGSYPKYGDDATRAGHRVLVTIESKDRGAVDAAFRDLLARLRPSAVVASEPPRSCRENEAWSTRT